ncbi:hypothetical protein [Tenacibaculum amylolyticum]|uniref:hypothetical protein n=1 Tax=Tenacibaculum amylolyticum TaxID=104269 RepID=UPI0038945E9D
MKNEEIKRIILLFEDKKIKAVEAIDQINKISNKNLTEDDLLSYWKHTTLDDFIKLLLTDSIVEWKSLNDEKSLNLIQEIIDNLEDDSLISKNSEGLEKRYNKPKGTVSDLVFIEGVNNPIEILKKLKENTVMLL